MVSWEHYLWEEDRPLEMEAVRQFQQEYGIVYPSGYLSVLQLNQGKRPNPCEIDVAGVSTVATSLLHFISDEDCGVPWYTRTLRDDYPALVIPFANTPDGDLFCFDFRASRTDPTVVLLWHESAGDEAIFPVSETFEQFLLMLYEE
jgi:hypothetical protein